MAGQVEDFTPGGVFQGTNINFTAPLTSSNSSATNDTYTAMVNWDSGSNTLTGFNNNGEQIWSTVLDGIMGGGGGNAEDIYVSGGQLNGNVLELFRENANNVTVDLSTLIPAASDDNYVDSVTLTNNDLRLGRTGDLDDLVQDLSVFANVDNQVGVTTTFTQGDYVYTFTADNRVLITSAGVTPPAFTPSENNPAPMNALDTTEVTFPAPEANEGFNIDDVEVTMVDIKDTDGVTISTDLGNVTVNNDNTIDVALPPDEAVGDVELEVEVTDEEGEVATVNPTAELFTPYFTLSTALGTTYSTVSDFQDDAVESTEELGSSITVAGVGTGRKKYYAMVNGTATFTQQGFMLAATIEATGKIGEYTYNLYNLGDFGNPFDATEASPNITLDVTLT